MPFTNAPSVASYPAAVQGHQTGSAGGSMAGENVIESVYSVYDPFSIARLAHKRHGKRPGFAEMLDMMGPDYNVGAKAPVIGHYEVNNWVGQMVKIGSIDTASSGAGNDMIIVLHADNMDNLSVDISGSTAYSSNVRKNDVILLPGGKTAVVKSKGTLTTNPHEVTIAPMDASVDLDDYVSAGEVYTISHSAHAEASGLPEGLIPKTFKYTNTFGIIKEAAYASGSSLTNEPFVQYVQGANDSVFAVMNQDAMDRFNRSRSGLLFWGEPNDNVNDTTTQLGYDALLKSTEGFMAFRAGNSYTDTYNPAAYTLDEIAEIAAIFEQENVGERNICSLQGYQYRAILDAALEDKYDQSLQNTLLVKSLAGYDLGMDRWQPIIEEQDFVAWLGWQGIRRNDFSFHFKMMHEFTAADGGGAAAYSYSTDAIFIPLSRQKDVTTGEQRPSIGYNWKQLGGYSRKMIFGTYAGAGVGGNGGYVPQAVNQYDSVTTFMVAEHAGHFSCPNKIVYHTQA